MSTDITKKYRRSYLRMGVAIYCVLLALTALFGLPDIDRKFDIENALGTQNLSPSDKGLEVVSVTRIPLSPELRNPETLPVYLRDRPWRARSTGYAIAPFVVIDETAFRTDALRGLSGHRFVFWFFGFSKWTMLKTYWVSERCQQIV
jgi:hypothetical protein